MPSSTSKNNDTPNLFLVIYHVCSLINTFEENERIPLTSASSMQNLLYIQWSSKCKRDKTVSDLLNIHLICNKKMFHFNVLNYWYTPIQLN